jgi:hypothetical protein
MGSKKTKTKTTENVNTTTKPVISEPYSTSFQNFTGQIDDFMASDPTKYVAPASELQNLAFEQAKNLGAGNEHIGKASGYAAQAANAPASKVSLQGYQAPKLGAASTYAGATLADPRLIAQYMDAYRNPYTGQVIDATMAEFDEYAGSQRARMAADAAKTAAFGGSRYGIAEGQMEGELARGRASTIANLLDRSFMNAAQLGSVDAGAANQYGLHQADLRQQAGLANMGARNQFALTQAGLNADAAQFGANAANQQSMANASLLEQQYQRALAAAGIETNLGQLAGSQELAQLGAVAELGGVQRGIQSEYTNAVPTQLQMGASLYGSLDPALYAGTNTTGTMTGTSTQKTSGGVLPMLAGSALQAGAATYGGGGWTFSDRRLKTDIERIGDYGKIGLYRYNMFGTPSTGVMADEVAEHYPEALGPEVAGFATVNYDKLSELTEMSDNV